MRAHAIRISRHGGGEVLEAAAVELEPPGPGQALVAVHVAGVNFIDVYHRTGLYRPAALPMTLGQEGAGTVVAVGAGVALAPGARVAWASVSGSYASHILAPADRLVTIPDGVGDQAAAALMLQGMTAHYLAHGVRPLVAGDACLIHAAAGGVGLLLCQLARRAGARVLATTSTAAKAERARAAGAAEVALYDRGDLGAWARQRTDGVGVDVAYDSVGLATWEASLAALRRRGLLVLFGQSSGSVPPIDPQLLSRAGSVYLTRPTLVDYVATRAELEGRAGDLFAALGGGELTVTIDRVLPLADAALAHRLLESRTTSGKLLLAV